MEKELYPLAQSLTRHVPEDASILFLYENFVDFKRVLYYLYPRKVSGVSYLEIKGPNGLAGADYIGVYLRWLPGAGDYIRELAEKPGLKLLYSNDRGAVYKVGNNRALTEGRGEVEGTDAPRGSKETGRDG